MLKVVGIEKDALQVVADHIDGSVGGIPNLTVIDPLGCCDLDVNMGFFTTGNEEVTINDVLLDKK